MSSPTERPDRTGPTGRRHRTLPFGVALAIAVAFLGAVGCESFATRNPATASRPLAGSSTAPRPSPPTETEIEAETESAPVRPGDGSPLDEADGVVHGDVSIFDDHLPAVTRLDPALLAALRRAATDAADDGVLFFVNSGWRSTAYQEQLRREAIARYGSEAEAARWVASPERSEHVSGDAVDVGHPDAARWLAAHGARYGLCQTYRNEPWHYELRPDAVGRSCPPPYADPTQDPRMHP